MNEHADQHDAPTRRSHRRQWLIVLTLLAVLLVTYIGLYFALTYTLTPPGLNRTRVFPSRAVRAIWAPLYAAERWATGISAAVTYESGTTVMEDEWEVIVIDVERNTSNERD